MCAKILLLISGRGERRNAARAEAAVINCPGLSIGGMWILFGGVTYRYGSGSCGLKSIL